MYTITDVAELGQWHRDKLASHPLYRELTPAEYASDPCIALMTNSTEEGQKVTRKGGEKHFCVFERK